MHLVLRYASISAGLANTNLNLSTSSLLKASADLAYTLSNKSYGTNRLTERRGLVALMLIIKSPNSSLPEVEEFYY